MGSYTGSASPYGTFDQGGNVWEWNEAIMQRAFRGCRGGAYFDHAIALAASRRGIGAPADEVDSIGFRVAMIPEPGGSLLRRRGPLACSASPAGAGRAPSADSSQK